jgi:hypothetical protein
MGDKIPNQAKKIFPCLLPNRSYFFSFIENKLFIVEPPTPEPAFDEVEDRVATSIKNAFEGIGIAAKVVTLPAGLQGMESRPLGKRPRSPTLTDQQKFADDVMGAGFGNGEGQMDIDTGIQAGHDPEEEDEMALKAEFDLRLAKIKEKKERQERERQERERQEMERKEKERQEREKQEREQREQREREEKEMQEVQEKERRERERQEKEEKEAERQPEKGKEKEKAGALPGRLGVEFLADLTAAATILRAGKKKAGHQLLGDLKAYRTILVDAQALGTTPNSSWNLYEVDEIIDKMGRLMRRQSEE